MWPETKKRDADTKIAAFGKAGVLDSGLSSFFGRPIVKRKRRQLISTRMPAVIVEYDTAKGRRSQRFEDVYQARRFFMAKDRDDWNPKIRKAD